MSQNLPSPQQGGGHPQAPSLSQTTASIQSGWMPDPYAKAEMRYFDGSMWTEHVLVRGVPSIDPIPGVAQVAHAQPLHASQPPVINITNTAVANGIPSGALKKTNHLVHIVMTILTAGLWIPIWILVHYSNKKENFKNFGIKSA